MNKMIAIAGACALTLASAHSASADDKSQLEKCLKKLSKPNKEVKGVCAVLKTLHCIEEGDAQCARAGYTSEFVKLHNGVDTNTDINAAFADGVFNLLHITLDIDHFEKTDEGKLSIRYVETVQFTPSFLNDFLPFPVPLPDATFLQHEHALVSFDKDGRMTAWDQYGDNKEQKDVDDYAAALIAFLASLGF